MLKNNVMSKGYSLHIGLNKVNPRHYPGVPELNAAVNDAVFWESYAKQLGYSTASLHDGEATTEAVLAALGGCAEKMKAGDILLLTYAGHGSELPNDKAEGFDDERNDQTWCLYDRQLLDDELFAAFRLFAEGTRIVVVSDSCHSGTMVRALPDELDLSAMLESGLERAAGSRGLASRKLPLEVEQAVVQQFGETVYRPVQRQFETQPQAEDIKAAVKLLAACQDNQTTFDGEENGVFTESFMQLFEDDAFCNATAEELINRIRENYYFPRPNFFQYGAIIPSFDQSFPFIINIPDAAKVTGYRAPDLGAVPVERTAPTGIQVRKNAVLVLDIAGDAGFTGGQDIEILDEETFSGGKTFTIELLNTPHEHAWSAAHALQQELAAKGIQAQAEPVISVNPAQDRRAAREADASNPDYIKDWPPVMGDATGGIGWHLDADHSQLAKAAETVSGKPGAHVRIAHLDTGYIPGHAALPLMLDMANQRSFVKKEDPKVAVDKTDSGQDGHGLGTIVLLAGNRVKKEDTYDEYEGFIGGIPFAEVVPLRISESVVIMNSKNFSAAVRYAIEQGCEVISMSMAGKPDNRMAQAVNDAYEAGVVIVSAASNCWYKGTGALLPKCVMFPAAFERVIAATGAMFDHQPYDVKFLRTNGERAIGTQYMQGSWGPASRMTRALAAYTPNTPWASTAHTFLRSGGGTSSATPQVAAAAALWIAYHREEMEKKGYYEEGRKWLKVEAVRHALYTAAARDAVFPEWEKYYGNGILRAWDALQVGVADESELSLSPKAESSFFGIVETVGSFFKRRKLFRNAGPKPPENALGMELLHLLQTDPRFYELFSRLDLGSPSEVEKVLEDGVFQAQVLQSPYASAYLKEAILQ
ncbi:hypothetical protein CCY01nite_40320 [Chitinophaga cymbidii]|uniref:Uncharacterized protein n=2 Tax=Chitinophaga cymbidii TaxID=1096750 RepID=A0A512RQ02_9BACT|nr:hypothetical protein CCY01nite_40320 [Chitinophaga cymbidii]